MNNKLLVIIHVPSIEREFDLYMPIVKKVGAVKELIIKIVEKESDGIFQNDGCKFLYDKITGERIDDNIFVRDSNIRNGSKLVLY